MGMNVDHPVLNDGAGVSGVNKVPKPLDTEHVHHGGDNSIVDNSVDPGIEGFDETKNICSSWAVFDACLSQFGVRELDK